MKAIFFLLLSVVSILETTPPDSSKVEHIYENTSSVTRDDPICRQNLHNDSTEIDTNYQGFIQQIDDWQERADSLQEKLILIQQKLEE